MLNTNSFFRLSLSYLGFLGNIEKFIAPLVQKENFNIILTGAGSSAFIGESVKHLYQFKKGIYARAISTTTLLTYFQDFIDTEIPLLLISFTRSGNSPESNVVVDITESICDEVYHIAITCNERGKLAKKITKMPNSNRAESTDRCALRIFRLLRNFLFSCSIQLVL